MPSIINRPVYDIIEMTGEAISPNSNTAYNDARSSSTYISKKDKADYDGMGWGQTPTLAQIREEVEGGYEWTIKRVVLYWDISDIPDCGEI